MMQELPYNLLAKAEAELNENAERREKDIENFREMIASNSALRNCCVESEFLLRFLRARKFQIDRALKLYINFYRIRRENPEVFQLFHPRSVAHVIHQGLIGIMPERNDKEQTLLVMRLGLWNPDECPNTDILKALLICVENALKDPVVQINGLIVVIDLIHFTLRRANQFGMQFCRRVSRLLQYSTPVRVKAIHIVNEPPVFACLYAVVKPFLKDKTQRRLVIHGINYQALHKHIAPHLLPVNASLGGNGPALPIHNYLDELLNAGEHYEKIMMYSLSDS